MAKKASIKPITAAEFDRRFDAGEDMSAYLDWSSLRSFYGPDKKPIALGEKPKVTAKPIKSHPKTREATKTR